mgnify:FL=1
MIQTDYCPDKFGTYLSHPESLGGGIDLSDSSVREIILAYRSYRRTLNPSFNNDHILRRVDQLEEEFSCILMPSQITDVFYANFIQWAHEKGNCFSTIKLYCNQLKSALNWASRHGCKLSQTYNVYEVPRYFKSRVALSQDEISHITHFDVSRVARRPQYRRTLERVRDMFVLLCNLGQRYSDIRRISPENFERNLFRIIQQKTGNRAVVDIDRYAIVPKLTYSLLKKYGYRSPYTSSVSNYDRYLHSLLREIGEEFNDTVITEVKVGGVVNRSENQKWELCTSHTGRRTFISYNVMRCPTEAEVRKCSGHKSAKTFERYISFDED